MGKIEKYRKIIAEQEGEDYASEVMRSCEDTANFETCMELYSVEPRADLLHQILGFYPPFVSVIRVSFGAFMARRKGAIGYDVWLGYPSEQSRKRTTEAFDSLTFKSRKLIIDKLKEKGIEPSEVGIKPYIP